MNIYLMIGLPGSGKSTLARKIKLNSPDTYIVEKDKIREMLYGYYDYFKKDEMVIDVMTRQMIWELVNNGKNIVLDETHLTFRERRDIVDFIRNIRRDCRIYYVHCDETRNNLNNRLKDPKGLPYTRWEDVINELRFKLQEPTQNEYRQLGVLPYFEPLLEEVRSC